jgi:hypothetical protein
LSRFNGYSCPVKALADALKKVNLLLVLLSGIMSTKVFFGVMLDVRIGALNLNVRVLMVIKFILVPW